MWVSIDPGDLCDALRRRDTGESRTGSLPFRPACDEWGKIMGSVKRLTRCLWGSRASSSETLKYKDFAATTDGATALTDQIQCYESGTLRVAEHSSGLRFGEARGACGHSRSRCRLLR